MREIKSDISIGSSFNFKRIDVASRSAISAELSPDCRKGIYFYIFNDGTSYVGKSVDMVRRHADHLHEYKHRLDFNGLEIEKAYFMTIDENADDKELDDLETAVIQQAEHDGYNLRNLQKTNLPAGKTNYILDFNEREMRLLPWKREERTSRLPSATLQKPTNNQVKRFEKLKQLENSDYLFKLTTKYVHETMTEPANTVGIYWSATVYPSRKNGPSPALRITCGTLETLSVWHDEVGYFGFVNIKQPEDDSNPLPRPFESLANHKYAATQNVITTYFVCLAELDEMLNDEHFLDWCYRLNIEMFRHCKNPQAKFTNPLLVNEILK